ncbi:MAG TPA: hypothetical protein VHQ65_14300 [Thermoanaerobaculia bacterium]|nr:hypothetical protein [Thermoanaerobaculia bacterium]
MTRLRKRLLCLTVTVWALFAPLAAGAAILDESQHPAAWSWPEPVTVLQDWVQEWLAGVFGSSEVPGVEADRETPMTSSTGGGGEALSRIVGHSELHPDFDPDG